MVLVQKILSPPNMDAGDERREQQQTQAGMGIINIRSAPSYPKMRIPVMRQLMNEATTCRGFFEDHQSMTKTILSSFFEDHFRFY